MSPSVAETLHLSNAVMPSMLHAEDRDFDTTISGPWMDRWELVHHNRHVAAHLAASAAGKQQWTFA